MEKEIKQAVLSVLAAALMASPAVAVWAGAPASPLAQTQTIMGSDASPETKLDVLYNGGSARQLGVSAPGTAAADAGAKGARHLAIGAAPAAAAGLGQGSVPSPALAATDQARVGYWELYGDVGRWSEKMWIAVLFTSYTVYMIASPSAPRKDLQQPLPAAGILVFDGLILDAAAHEAATQSMLSDGTLRR